MYVRFNTDGTIKSTVGKFFDDEALRGWGERFGAGPGDVLLVLSGETDKVRKQLGELRLEVGRRLGLMTPGVVKPLWVLDFPLLEWDDDTNRFYAMHHPFTAPKPEEIDKMNSTTERMPAIALSGKAKTRLRMKRILVSSGITPHRRSGSLVGRR